VSTAERAQPRPDRRRRPRSRRRRVLVALLLAAAALAALPALTGGLLPWAGERAVAPPAGPVPDTTIRAPVEPATRPADQAGPPTPAGNDGQDRGGGNHDQDDDSSGSGPGGDGDGGGGGSGGHG